MALAGNGLFAFGALLKTFRKRKRLTQQQLAEALGIHRSTIIRWEQGDYLPESRAMVLELARHLHLNDQESRQLLEASLTALAPHWLVPLSRNPFFTGREEILDALHAQLRADQAVTLTQPSALHGLGGVGKTQIALEYTYRYALEYSAIFWIEAETVESIISSLLQIAEVLQLSGQTGKEQQWLVQEVQSWLTTHSQWLLIWDNVEDLDVLDRFLPGVRPGFILITTRQRTLGTVARGIDLFPMGQEEGILFLLRRAKVLEPNATHQHMQQYARQMPPQYAAASALVKAMGGLPLALDQAGSYLEETQCGLPAYLDLFRNQRAALLQQRGKGARAHPASVSTTLTLAITATTQHHPAVEDLLRVCALLQPDAIPEDLFLQGAEHLGAELEAVCCNPLDWNQVVAVACSYSLLARQSEKRTISLHRLVQAVLLDTMTESERKQWNRRIIEALNSMFSNAQLATGYATWKQGEQLLPHALLCLQRVGTNDESLVIASLVYKVAQFLRERGQYAEAEPLYQRAIHIQEQMLGPDHSDLAFSIHYLAVLYYHQGKYEQAESLYLRAQHIWEQTLGSDHPQVAVSLNNLAILSYEQGRPQEAESFYQRALRIQEQALGSDHPQIAALLNNLALLLYKQGRDQEAESFYQRALQIQERTLGANHPQITHSLNGLADILAKQGKYEQAEGLYLRAINIREQALGSDHPEMVYLLNDLARLLAEQEKHEQTEALYVRALQICEQSLGEHHPLTAKTLHDMATFRQKQGDLCQALSLTERARKIYSQSLGDTHPLTIATSLLQAQLRQEQPSMEEDAKAY